MSCVKGENIVHQFYAHLANQNHFTLMLIL